jgi:hypothetical protein
VLEYEIRVQYNKPEDPDTASVQIFTAHFDTRNWAKHVDDELHCMLKEGQIVHYSMTLVRERVILSPAEVVNAIRLAIGATNATPTPPNR